MFETCKSAANEFNAGKYMLEDTAEKNPPQEAMNMINRFWFGVNTECNGATEDAVVRVGLASVAISGSSLAVGVLARALLLASWCCDGSCSDNETSESVLPSSLTVSACFSVYVGCWSY